MNHLPLSLYLKSPYDLVEDIGHGLKMFRHPLYNTLWFPRSQETNMVNIGLPTPEQVVAQRLQQLQKAKAKTDVHAYVFIHERPWRFQALLDAQEWTETLTWFKAAGDVWVDCEGPGRNAEIWRMMVFDTKHAMATMDEADQAFFEGLPQQIRVYRGAATKAHARRGLSWTMDQERAVWFAKRFSCKTPHVADVLVPKSAVASAFVRRGERELILTQVPRSVKVRAL